MWEKCDTINTKKSNRAANRCSSEPLLNNNLNIYILITISEYCRRIWRTLVYFLVPFWTLLILLVYLAFLHTLFFYETKCASKGSQVFARCAIRAGKAIRNLRNEFHSIEAHQSTSTMIYSNKTTTKKSERKMIMKWNRWEKKNTH